MNDHRTRLRTDTTGVSPVVGIALLIAITVILAAVIGTFALGLGSQQIDPMPTTSVDVRDAPTAYDTTPNQSLFVLSHSTGDQLHAEDLRLTIRNASSDALVATFDPVHDGAGSLYVRHNGANISAEANIQTGDSLTVVDAANNTLDAGTEYAIAVIHRPSGSSVAERTVTLV